MCLTDFEALVNYFFKLILKNDALVCVLTKRRHQRTTKLLQTDLMHWFRSTGRLFRGEGQNLVSWSVECFWYSKMIFGAKVKFCIFSYQFQLQPKGLRYQGSVLTGILNYRFTRWYRNQFSSLTVDFEFLVNVWVRFFCDLYTTHVV